MLLNRCIHSHKILRCTSWETCIWSYLQRLFILLKSDWWMLFPEVFIILMKVVIFSLCSLHSCHFHICAHLSSLLTPPSVSRWPPRTPAGESGVAVQCSSRGRACGETCLCIPWPREFDRPVRKNGHGISGTDSLVISRFRVQVSARSCLLLSPNQGPLTRQCH